MQQLRNVRVTLFLLNAGFEMPFASNPVKVSPAAWTATVYRDPELRQGYLVVGVIWCPGQGYRLVDRVVAETYVGQLAA